MGLLDSLLEVPERLRVWQMAGVRHFYIDPDAAVAAGPPAAGTPAGEEPAAAMASPLSTDRPTMEAAAEAGETPPPLAAPSDEPRSALLPDDPARWAAPWPALFAKAPARPLLVITYADLGFDLTGQADPRRGGLWRALLRDLHLAGKNAVAFWPFALPTNTILTDCPHHFAAGISLLAPTVLAVFGTLPPAVASALRQTGQPMPVIEQFPHPGTLLARDPEAWNHVCTTLSQFV